MVSKQPFARRILLAFVLMTVMVSGIFSIGIVAVVHFVCGFHGHPATYSINIRPLIPR